MIELTVPVAYAATPGELPPSHVDALRALLHDRAGIALDTGKEYLVAARLGPVARRAGLGSVATLIELVVSGLSPYLRDAVVEAMTINETSFFRDAQAFAALRATILPAVFQRPGRIRIWCAAAATGQEPYSLAMLVRQHFAAHADRVDILATDLATGPLERAAAGCYTQLEVNRGLPAPLLLRYFGRNRREWQLNDEIRQMVRFRRLNLVGPWPAGEPFDLVLLRNVLIYFDEPTRQRVLDRTSRVLRPDGWLVLGASEPTAGRHPDLVRVPAARAMRYRPLSSTRVPR
jgi:chemotaxis protein methyltransferase CheR